MSRSASVVQLCTFRVGDLDFALEVTRIQEVIQLPQITRVPLASSVVRGLINLRGQIVTAIDLRARRSMPPAPPPGDEGPMNVVIRSDKGLMSLVVDDIGDVIEVSEDTFERPPSTLDPTLRSIVAAVCKQPGRLLLVLEADEASTASVP